MVNFFRFTGTETMRKLFLFILLLCASYILNSQTLRYIKGVKSVEIIYGNVNSGNGILMGINYCINNSSSISVGGGHCYGKTGYTTFKRYFTHADFNYLLISIKDKMYLTSGPGMILGYEFLKGETNEIRESFLASISLSLDVEIALLDKISLVGKSEYYRHIRTNLNKNSYFVGGGLKIYIY